MDQNWFLKRLWVGVALLLILLVSFWTAAAQTNLPSDANEPLAEPLEPDGGGEYELGHVPHVTAEQRAEIQAQIDANISMLRSQGMLPTSNALTTVFFSWPLRAKAGFEDFGYHGVSNFVDHDDHFHDHLEDYMCGDRSYDTESGYNHRGTDYFLWPHGWNKMDEDVVEIIAAASGTIVLKQDGHFDMNCGFNNDPWNAVYVQHADGSIAWYGHLKNGSLTTKDIGESVVAGEYLGVVGSSGSSTGPHLHLEIYDSDNNLIDPYAGSCNTLNTVSWWGEQPAYYDSGINKITTGDAASQDNSCPNLAETNEKDEFMPGDTIYFTTYYRDQLDTQESRYIIYRPDGTIYQQWTHNSNEEHYAASWWYWIRTIGSNEPEGEWRYVVQFEGQAYQHEFLVGQSPTPAEVPNLQITKAEGDLQLSWSPVTLDSQGQNLTTESYNIYRSTSPYFSPSSENLIATIDDLSFLDVDAIGNEAQVYYQVTATNQFGGESSQSQTVGMFNIEAFPGWNLVSLPNLPIDFAIDAVLGTTLFGAEDPTLADRVLVWDGTAQTYETAWFCGGSVCETFGEEFYNHWLANDFSQSNLLLEPDSSFWFQNRSGDVETITIVGAVPSVDRTINVPADWQLLGSSIPTSKSLDDANIPATGTEDPTTADRILYWDPLTQSYESSWFCGGPACEAFGDDFYNHWLANDYSQSPIVLEPGRGFWLQNRHDAFNWIDSVP